MQKVIFSDDSIKILNYQINPGSFFSRDVKIELDMILEDDYRTIPTSIITKDRDVFFIDHKFDDTLESYVKEKSLQVSEREDIWGLINEPFLDMEFSEMDETRNFEILSENGIKKSEVLSIREEISNLMNYHNYFAWEFYYFGLYDLLRAKRLSFPFYISKKFYYWALDISLRNME